MVLSFHLVFWGMKKEYQHGMGMARNVAQLLIFGYRTHVLHQLCARASVLRRGVTPRFPRSVGLEPIQSPPKRALPMAPSADCHSQLISPSSIQPVTSADQIPAKTPNSIQR